MELGADAIRRAAQFHAISGDNCKAALVARKEGKWTIAADFGNTDAPAEIFIWRVAGDFVGDAAAIFPGAACEGGGRNDFHGIDLH